MRPRPDAAENMRLGSEECGDKCRFNEAAARCRGKRFQALFELQPNYGFNEAAARCRGKRASSHATRWARNASMRPRPDAAENAVAAATGVIGDPPLQ